MVVNYEDSAGTGPNRSAQWPLPKTTGNWRTPLRQVKSASRIPDGQQVWRKLGGLTYVFSLAFSADGRLLAVAEASELPNVWRTYDSQVAYHLPPSGVFATFSQDGRWLAAASQDGVITLSRAKDGKSARSFPGWSPLAFSPDSSLLAYKQDVTHVGLLSLGESVMLRPLKAPSHTAGTVSLRFSRDGKLLLASGSPGKTLVIWRVPDGRVELVSTLSKLQSRRISRLAEGEILRVDRQDYATILSRPDSAEVVFAIPHDFDLWDYLSDNGELLATVTPPVGKQF